MNFFLQNVTKGGHNISMFPLGEALIIFTICEGGL